MTAATRRASMVLLAGSTLLLAGAVDVAHGAVAKQVRVGAASVTLTSGPFTVLP